MTHRTMPAGPPALQWRVQSLPASRRRLSAWRPEGGSRAERKGSSVNIGWHQQSLIQAQE